MQSNHIILSIIAIATGFSCNSDRNRRISNSDEILVINVNDSLEKHIRISYWSNGVIQTISELKGSQLSGKSIIFSPEGKLIGVNNYFRDKKISTQYTFDMNTGNIITMHDFDSSGFLIRTPK